MNKRPVPFFARGPFHFIGIGGIGMSGIAEVLMTLGYQVQGSDAKRSKITDRLETLGASVHRAVWNGGWSDVEFDAACAVLRAQGAQMNYAALAAGTVLPAGASTAGASAHRATWPIAYTIGGVRDWLFAQSKAG